MLKGDLAVFPIMYGNPAVGVNIISNFDLILINLILIDLINLIVH